MAEDEHAFESLGEGAELTFYPGSRVTPIQVLWGDGERIVYRALRDEPAGERRAVIVVLPASENLWAEGAPGRGATFCVNPPAAIPGT